MDALRPENDVRRPEGGRSVKADPLARADSSRQARRFGPGYSRFVQLMKVLLPLIAVLLVGLIFLWPSLMPDESRFRVGFSSLGATGTDGTDMLNPRFVGTDAENRPFSVTADVAKNVLQGAARVELEMPKADITLEDGTWLVLTAENGIYTREDKVLDLAGAVNLFHDSGYEFRTTRARINLGDGVAAGREPVEGQGPFGHLKAEGFRISERGKRIEFTGRASAIFYPGATRGDA